MKLFSKSKLTAFTLLALTIGSCSKKVDLITGDQTDQSKIMIDGSNSELKLVQHFLENYETGDSPFSLKGNGSTKGIQQFINRKLQVLNSSRTMSTDEIEQAKQNGINPVPVVIAIDAIGMVVNQNNPVDSISTINLSRVLSGEIDNWKDLGGWDAPIHLIGRDTYSGTKTVIEDMFTAGEGLSRKFKNLPSNDAILKEIVADSLAFSYVSAAYLMNENGLPNGDIWALNIYIEGESKAYSPFEYLEVVSGNYPVTRPLYQYFDNKPSGKLADFLNFEMSQEGKSIIQKSGYFPISSYYEQKNAENGLLFNDL